MSDAALEKRGRPRAHSPLLIAGHWEKLLCLFLPTQGSGSLEKEDSQKGQALGPPLSAQTGRRVQMRSEGLPSPTPTPAATHRP